MDPLDTTPPPAAAPATPAESPPASPPAGDVGGEVVELEATRQRKARQVAAAKKEAKRQRDAKAARDRRAAKKAAKDGDAGDPDDGAADREEDERDEVQRCRETGGAWRLLLRILGVILWPFGFRVEQLTKEEFAEDVALLEPLSRRHTWLEVTIRYAALPYLLVERLATKVKRREADKSETKGATP